jgi:hypothetical protein
MSDSAFPTRIAISEPMAEQPTRMFPIQMWGKTFDVVVHGGKWCAIDEGGHEVLCLPPQAWEDKVENGAVSFLYD